MLKKLEIEESLKQLIMIICDFCRVKTIIINGNLRTIDKTNITYLEPHRIIIENLNNKIKLSELENYNYEK